MPKISKAQTYAVEYLYTSGKNIDFICEDLNLSKKQIETIIQDKNLTTQISNANTETINENKQSSNNARIMTKNDSMLADDLRKKTQPTTVNHSHIFRPKNK